MVDINQPLKSQSPHFGSEFRLVFHVLRVWHEKVSLIHHVLRYVAQVLSVLLNVSGHNLVDCEHLIVWGRYQIDLLLLKLSQTFFFLLAAKLICFTQLLWGLMKGLRRMERKVGHVLDFLMRALAQLPEDWSSNPLYLPSSHFVRCNLLVGWPEFPA